MKKFSQKSIEGKVCRYINKYRLLENGEKIVVGVSGGPDSIALLNILLSLRENFAIKVSACHFNHRLRGEESDKDELFVKKICAKEGIECETGGAPEKNIYNNEDEARIARYSFFEKILEEGRADKIALAHNLNDLSETVLLRLLRGTGVQGLRAIPARRGKFIRPLLSVSRPEIEEYLNGKRTKFRTDQSNFDTSIPRNFLRIKVLPMLSKVNPNIVETLSGLAMAATEDYDLLENISRKALEKLLIKESESEIILDCDEYLSLHPSMQRMVLREAISRLAELKDIGFKHLEEIRRLLAKGEGKKFKTLPHSLHIELRSGKIMMSIDKKEKN